MGPRSGKPHPDPWWPIRFDGATATERYLKACDLRRWHHQGRRRLQRAQEEQRRRQGLIAHDRQPYASDAALQHCAAMQQQAQQWAATHGLLDLTSGHYQPLTTQVARQRSQLAAQAYAILKALQTLAEEAQLCWAMLTVTLPGPYHACPKHPRADHRYNGIAPDEAHRAIAQRWHRLLAQLRKHDIHLSGLRTVEPHHDGTPHWHVAFFYDPAQLPRIQAAILTQFGGPLCVRWLDARGRRVQGWWDDVEHLRRGNLRTHASGVHAAIQLELGSAKTAETAKAVASFASYVFKYVAKSLQRRPQSAREPAAPTAGATPKRRRGGGRAAEPAAGARVHAWRSLWGLRAFDFFGLPPGAIGAWQQLRRLDLEQAATTGHLSPDVVQLARLCQSKQGAGMAPFLRLLGGLRCAPLTARLRIEPPRQATTNRYSGRTHRLEGLIVHDLQSGRRHEVRLAPPQRVLLHEQAAASLQQALAAGWLGRTQVCAEPPAALPLGSLATIATYLPDAPQCAAQQLEQAVRLPRDGHHHVQAAAGAGKTELLLRRAQWLIEQGVAPHHIVLTTFKREAARELHERLMRRGLQDVQVGTMHALARRWLGLEAHVHPPDFDGWLERSLEQARQGRPRYWLLVDEAQDLSPLQWAWVQAHARASLVVGDERQAIHGWRGADLQGLRRWAQASRPRQRSLFEPETEVGLSYSRRCAEAICALANALPLAAAPMRAMRAGGRLEVLRVASEAEQLQALLARLPPPPAGAAEPESQQAQCDTVVLVRTRREAAWLRGLLNVHDAQHVPVLTIHAAKGGQWRRVIVAFGARKPIEVHDPQHLQVWYTAITRAEDELHLLSIGCMPEAMEQAWAKVYRGEGRAPDPPSPATRAHTPVQGPAAPSAPTLAACGT